MQIKLIEDMKRPENNHLQYSSRGRPYSIRDCSDIFLSAWYFRVNREQIIMIIDASYCNCSASIYVIYSPELKH